MENKNILLSLCIPTYGVSEWVFPVLDSIYCQNIDENLYEVVITDNGSNKNFENEILKYLNKYKNLRYIKTTSYSFVNEIDSYKNANGKFIKFINHRTKLENGTINYLLNFIRENENEKPIVYFSNGVLHKNKVLTLNSFDEYIRNLDIYSSWSTGMAFWKEHFDQMDLNQTFNELFPHTNILFDRKQEHKYIIDDTSLLYEIPVSSKNKGKYDLFYAFAVEYPGLLLDLYRNGYISNKTFMFVKKQNLKFIRNLYFDFVVRKKECSYDLSGFNDSIKVFYSKYSVKKAMLGIFIKRIFLKAIRLFRKEKRS